MNKLITSEIFIDVVKQKIAEDCGKENVNTVLVWFSKAIQNWKGLFYCQTNDRYYEATFNGDKNELYLDCYKTDHKKVFKTTEGEI